MTRRQLTEAARSLNAIGPISRALAQRPLSPGSSPGLVLPEGVALFDVFRHAVVPGTSCFLSSSFWQEVVMQMAHTEPAIWHATVALGALHRKSHALIQARPGNERLLSHQALLHYDEALALSKQLDSPMKLATLSVALIAVASLLEKWSEMHAHIMAGFRILMTSVTDMPGRQALQGALMKSDLQAMSFSDSRCPYPFEDSSTAFAVNKFLASPYVQGDSYEELTTELFGLIRALFILEDGTITANAVHGPWITSFEAYLRRLAVWENRMQSFEAIHWPTESELMIRLSIRLYHVTLRILLQGTSFGPEKRWDPLLGYFEYAVRLAVSLNGQMRAANAANLSLEPGLILPLWVTSHRCRHPGLRRASIKLLKEAKRIEGMWTSDAVAEVMRTVVAVEEESLCFADAEALAPLELELSSLIIPWSAWSKPGFNVPSTLTWSNVPIIPEENRVKEVLGTARFRERFTDLRLMMGSNDNAKPFGSVRETTVNF